MSPTSIQIEERLGGWSGMLRHPLRTLWNLRQRLAAAQEEIVTLRARLAEAETLIEKIKLSVIEPTDPNWADAVSARRSRFDIADWCSAFTHGRKANGPR